MVTLLHEVGHVLHHLFSRARLHRFASFRCETDFVEAPSQMLENYCWQPATLALLCAAAAPIADADARALQDPRNASAPRRIGQYCVPPPPNAGWNPSFPIDIHLAAGAEGAVTFRLAVYVVDFDGRGRKQSVTLMDRATLAEVAPGELLVDFTGGVWLLWQYDRSVRLRFNYIRGDNQVVSAVAFDVVPTATRSR